MSDQTPTSDRRPRQSGRLWGALALVAVAVSIVAGVRGARFLTPDCEQGGCPELGALHSYTPPEPPRIYDEKGKLVGRLPGPQRIVVDLSEIPRVVQDGYVAVEDRRFRDHDGVDPKSALRAFFANLSAGSVAEGGSTITMQLARNLFEADVVRWNRFRRKFAELRISRLIEDQLSKDEILELYLNQIYLGDGVYGVEAASRHYFGKPVARVDLREAALLIGLAKNPEGYNPRQNLAAANERIGTVLDILEREGVVSPEEADAARSDNLELSDDGSMPEWGKNAYYLSAVRRELHRIIPEPARRSGLYVFTGLDPRAQAAAVDALDAQLRAIEGGRWGAYRNAAPAGELERVDVSPYLQGIVLAMDPATGLVTTLVGGRDFHHSEFDRAFQAKRQPGSAFKPIVYAVALGRGVRLSDRISTAPMRLAQAGAADWEPTDQVSARNLTVREALVESSSRAAVRLGGSVGVDRVVRQARQLGITTEIPRYPSVFLGAAEVVPAELVAAFAAFGNGGHRVEPHLITRVVDTDGVVLYRRSEKRGRALDERVAFLVLDVLREVVRVGSGWRSAARALPFPAAGKAGTSSGARDVWFVGLTPGLVAGVWMGFDTPRTIVEGGWGGNLAAPVWARFMTVANRGRKPSTSWKPPPGVEAVDIDTRTSLRANARCPAESVRREYYLKGSGPANGCPRLAVRPKPKSPARPPDSSAPRRAEERGGPERDTQPAGAPEIERARPPAEARPARPPPRPAVEARKPTEGRDSSRAPPVAADSTRPDSAAGLTAPPDSLRPQPSPRDTAAVAMPPSDSSRGKSAPRAPDPLAPAPPDSGSPGRGGTRPKGP